MLKNITKKYPILSIFIWILIVIIIIVAIPFTFVLIKYAWGMVGFQIEYSEGDRVGQIVKLSEKGLIWKTWEATMGITQSGAYAESWGFSIDSKNPDKEKLIADIQRAYNSGELVKIHYMQKYGTLPWRGETTYFVQSVEFLR